MRMVCCQDARNNPLFYQKKRYDPLKIEEIIT